MNWKPGQRLTAHRIVEVSNWNAKHRADRGFEQQRKVVGWIVLKRQVWAQRRAQVNSLRKRISVQTRSDRTSYAPGGQRITGTQFASTETPSTSCSGINGEKQRVQGVFMCAKLALLWPQCRGSQLFGHCRNSSCLRSATTAMLTCGRLIAFCNERCESAVRELGRLATSEDSWKSEAMRCVWVACSCLSRMSLICSAVRMAATNLPVSKANMQSTDEG